MAQTPEQTAADKLLHDAVNAFDVAYRVDGDVVNGVLVDVVVIYARQGFGDDGRGFTRYDWATPGEGIGWHRLIGLLEICRMQANAGMAGAGD